MSHASAKVRFSDGLICHGEYDGTTDVMLPRLWSTQQEMEAHWRQPRTADMVCRCGHDESVEIANTYADGEWWVGRACRVCMVITEGFEAPDDPPFNDGLPVWYDGPADAPR